MFWWELSGLDAIENSTVLEAADDDAVALTSTAICRGDLVEAEELQAELDFDLSMSDPKAVVLARD